MKIELTVSAQQIADIMTTAIESGGMTRAWCAGVYLRGEWEQKMEAMTKPWYAEAKIYEADFTISVAEIIDESKDAEGSNLRHYRLNAADFAKGIAVMATKYGRHFGDWMAENDDEVTGDVFLQCVTLGEVTYG